MLPTLVVSVAKALEIAESITPKESTSSSKPSNLVSAEPNLVSTDANSFTKSRSDAASTELM